MRRRQWRPLAAAMLVSTVMLLVAAGPVTALQVGDKAPEFSLPATTAERISLDDFVGQKPVVVFFYIYAFSDL